MSTSNSDASSADQSTTDQSTTGQSAIGQPAGGLPVDDDGNRVYPTDAPKDGPGQTASLRTYHTMGFYLGG